MIDITTIFILIASVLIVVKSADLIIKAAVNIAREFGVSEYFIGFAIIAMGTSLPELVTAIFGSRAGQGQLVLGNLVGANIVDATVVLGVMAIIGRKIKIEGQMFRTFDQTLFMTLSMIIMPFIFGFNGVITRFEGMLLVVAFIFYLRMLMNREERMRHRKHVVFRDIIKDLLTLAVAIPFILFSAKFLVSSAVRLAEGMGLSPYLIGLSFIALGTTIPELSIEIRSVLKGRKNIGFGDIIGSMIANVTLILGIAALINPIVFERAPFVTAGLFVLTSAFVALLFLEKDFITWKEGMALLFIYLTFIISEIVMA